MKYSKSRPSKSLPCGTGNLVIHCATGVAAAQALAKLGERAFVGSQISSVVQQALLTDASLAKQSARFRDPQVCYTLGPAQELTPESWSFPFEAFMSDGPSGE